MSKFKLEKSNIKKLKPSNTVNVFHLSDLKNCNFYEDNNVLRFKIENKQFSTYFPFKTEKILFLANIESRSILFLKNRHCS